MHRIVSRTLLDIAGTQTWHVGMGPQLVVLRLMLKDHKDVHFQGDGRMEEIRPDSMTLICIRTAVATLVVVKSEILDTMYTSVGVVTIHCM